MFEANAGQADPSVKFLSRGPGYALFLTSTEAALALIKSPPDATAARKGPLLRMRLVGANPQARVSGLQKLQGKVNYFIGDEPRQWRTNVPTYAKVKYEAVYPGVDLVYYGDGRQLEYDFVVAPGGDPKVIALAFEGADSLDVDARGDLVLAVNGSELRLRKPLVYQEVDGRRKPIAGNYIVTPDSRVGIQVAAYDATRPLVIDPVIVYATDLGGSGTDRAFAIAVDGAGNAYVTGDTISIDFPTKASVGSTYQSALSKSTTTDCFVTKINTTATHAASLVYSTYLGGSSNDQCSGIAINSSGNAFVTGQTNSTNFPGSALSKAKGSGDIFVVKLNATGSGLVYSAFLGGSAADAAAAIAIDGSGNASVTGKTASKDYPVVGGFQTSPGVTGGDVFGDAFVTKLNAQGTRILYSTYLRGSGSDEGRGIAADGAGNAYVTGTTASPNFPATPGALDGTRSGPSDAFVTKVNTLATGSASLVYSTYLGGSCAEQGRAIAVDGWGDVYVTGQTFSRDFPGASALGFQQGLGDPGAPACGATGDAFIAKLNGAGSALSYSTYLGGGAADQGLGIAVDGFGNAYVAGQTFSSDFPTPGGFATSLSGLSDSFVTRINTNVTGTSSLVYSTLLGGAGNESAAGIALDGAGNTHVTGQTFSSDFPAPGGFDTSLGGPSDAFVVKISVNAPPILTSPGNKVVDELALLSFTLGATDPDVSANDTLTFSISSGARAGMLLNASTGAFSWTPGEDQGPGFYTVTFRVTDEGTPALFDEKTITITVNEVNTAPVLTVPAEAQTVTQGVPLTFAVSAADADLNTLTYSIKSGFQAGMSLNASTGAFSWTPTLGQAPGVYTVTFLVTDDGTPGLSDEKTVTFTVKALLTVPSSPPTGAEGQLLTFRVADAGLPPNTWTFSASNLPLGATFDPATQTFAWTPTSAQGGLQPYVVYFTVSGGQLIDTKSTSITVSDTIVDLDGDGVPDPPGYDLDGDGVTSPPGVRNSQGQFEQDNSPDDFNPDQFDVCHNSAQTASAGSLVAASGSSTGALNQTLEVTFTGGTNGIHVLPVNLFNSICRLVDNSTGQQVPEGGVPEGPPINLSSITDGGDLLFVPGGQSVQTSTTFDLKLFYPNLADGSYSILCDYVNFAHDPQGEAPVTWTGKLSAPAQTVYNGQYVFSGFFSPADHEPFNQGRTVPVKFTLATSSGVPFTTALVKLFVQRLDSLGNPVGSPIPATSNDEGIGNTVPYNTAGSQYQYNMRTGPLAIGLWQLQAQLDDGTTKVITIVIR